MSGKLISLDALRAPKPVHYIDTMYGGQVGLKRLGTRTAMSLRASVGPDGQPSDPHAANRLIVAVSIVEPELDDAALDALEDDMQAYMDLIQKILDFNGLTTSAQKAAGRTFRPGDGESTGLPD